MANQISPASAARRKVNGFVRALQGLTPEERSVKPSAAFADDYNRTRQLVVEAYPHLEAHLPPRATVTCDTSGQAFREYQVWIEQMLGFLLTEERKAKPPDSGVRASVIEHASRRPGSGIFNDPAMG